MKEFQVCEVVNIEDKKLMTLSTEWLEDDVKIVILREGMIPLIGQTTITKLCELAPKKPREKTTERLKDELAGKDKGVQFSLKDSRLLWKKKMWKKGTIEVRPLDNPVLLGDLSLQWLKQSGSLQESTKNLRERNASLEKKTQQLTSQVIEMESMKNSMEDMLYKQFLLLLNSKKRRIRELEERLKNQVQSVNKSIYDESTDDDNDDDEQIETTKKRKKATNNRESTTSPVASTSKCLSKSPLQQFAESDEEIVLRYDESQRDERKSTLNVTEEDPDEELFSQ